MKVVFLHGLGQTARDWQTVIDLTLLPDVDCPELFSLTKGGITYPDILAGFEKSYEDMAEPFVLCGLSFGAILALDYTIRHPDKAAALVLVGAQYKVPTLLIDLQNLIFRLMPSKSFDSMGLSKRDTIQLSHSMRSLDFSHKLGEVVCPASIVCGEKDNANLKASRQLKALLPQSELHIIPDAGHEVNKSAPEAVSDIIHKLICKVDHVELALDKADKSAKENIARMDHEEVFGDLRGIHRITIYEKIAWWTIDYKHKKKRVRRFSPKTVR